MQNRKYLFSFFVVVLFFFSSIYFLSPTFFKIYLESYFQRQYHVELHFKALKEEDGNWIVDEPYLTKKNSLDLIATAEKITIKTNFEWKKRTLNLSWEIDHPEVNLEHIERLEALSLNKKSSHSFFNFSIFKIEHLVEINEGKINTNSEKAYFKLKGNEKNWLLKLSALIDYKEGLDFQYSRSNQQEEYSLFFNNFAFEKFQILSKAIFNNNGYIEEGVFQGHLKIIKGNQPLSIISDLTANNLKFKNDSSHLLLEIPKVKFYLSEKGWGDLSLIEPSNLKFKNEYLDFLAVDLQGQIHFKSLKDFEYLFKSKLVGENIETFQLTGGVFQNKNGNFNSNSELLLVRQNDNEEKLHLNFSHIQDFWFDCRGFFKNLEVKDSPFLKTSSIKEGTVDLSFLAVFDGLSLQTLNVDDFFIKNIKATIKDINFAASEVKGNLSVDCGAEQPFSTLYAQLKVDDGYLKDNKEKIKLDLLINKGEIATLNLTANSDTFNGSIHSFENPLNFYAAGKGKFESISKNFDIPHAFKNILEKDFAFEGLISKEEEKVTFEGSLEVESEKTFLSLQTKLKDFNFTLDRGSFFAKGISLEKYFSPDFLSLLKLNVFGKADIEAIFDESSLFVNYDIKNLKLENNFFSLDFSETQSIPGLYYFDFISGFHSGLLNLNKATYYEKISGLKFTDINSQLLIDKDSLFAIDLEAYCNDVYFTGDLNINKKKEGLEIALNTHNVNGNISNFKEIASFLSNDIVDLPFEGILSSGMKAGRLSFQLGPNEFKTDFYLKGSLSEGRVTSENDHFSLQDISVNFELDKENNFLLLSDLQGAIFVYSEEAIEEYLIASEQIVIHNLICLNSQFDFWIGNKNRDILRVAGTTIGNQKEIQFSINSNLTHFGNAHPEKFTFSLNKNHQLEKIDFQCQLEIETLLQDINRAVRTYIFPIPASLIRKLQDVKKASGNFQLSLKKENENEPLYCEMEGKNLHIAENSTEKCGLKILKKDSRWIVEECFFDDFSAAFEICFDEHFWDIPFLGAKYGNFSIAGFSGQFFPKQNHLTGTIELLEINLDAIKEIKFLNEFFNEVKLSGKYKGSGKIELEGMYESSLHCNLFLHGAFSGFKFNQLALKDSDLFSIYYNSTDGITIENIDSGFCLLETTPFLIKKAHINLLQREKVLDDLVLEIPIFFLTDFFKYAGFNIPFDEGKLTQFISQISSNEKLRGKVKYKKKKGYTFLIFELEENDLQIISVQMDPLSSKVLFQTKEYNIEIASNSFDFQKGVLTAKDKNQDSLCIFWERKDKEIYLKSVEGVCDGIKVDLHEKDLNILEGSISFDVLKIIPFLSKEYREKITTHQLNGLFHFLGELNLNQLSCEGFLISENVAIECVQFEKFRTHVHFGNDQINFSNLTIEDVSGSLEISHLSFIKEENEMKLSIPHISILDFQPHLLNFVKKINPFLTTSLKFKKIDLEDVKGSLWQKESFTAKGSLQLENNAIPSKKIQEWLFQEKISDLELDLKALWPVEGGIYFSLENGKIFLNKFKNMFSEGHLSKFYLSKEDPSYIDLFGNLNLFIKMKQYNLIYKFSELFTLSINGTIDNPTYKFISN